MVKTHSTIRVEIIGLPFSGKSSIIKSLEKKFSKKLSIISEFKYEKIHQNTGSKFEQTIYRFESLKLKHLLRSFKFKSAYVTIHERGPHDSLAYLHFAKILSKKGEKDVRNLQINNNLYKRSLKFAKKINAIILFTVSLKTAQKRRLLAGLNRDGKIVNNLYFPILSESYSYWLNKIYPKFKKKTNLLIVDGERSFPFNRKKVEAFIGYLIKLNES